MTSSRTRVRGRIVPCLCACGLVTACSPATADPEQALLAAIRPIATHADSAYDVNAIGRVLGDRRIVLLGENGHGVSEFSAFKVALVRHLHERYGFDVIAFESGYHECRQANEQLDQRSPRESMQDCLLVQLHHREIEPLFEYAADSRVTDQPLTIAGIDLQIQGWSTRTRPAFLRASLAAQAPRLGDTIAVLDSTLIEKTFQATDSVQRFMRRHGPFLRAALDSAAALAAGDTAWLIRGLSELVRRELHRAAAAEYGLAPPADVFEIRDLWMAETIRRLAEADTTRRIVVWLHNDHARYGEWRAGPIRVRAAGGFLREFFGDEVASVGLLMGSGSFADNFRREQDVPTPPDSSLESVFRRTTHRAAFLVLNASQNSPIPLWADQPHTYIRDTRVLSMRPGREFDVLVWFGHVSPADYSRTGR